MTYAISLALLLFLLNSFQYRVFVFSYSYELMIGFVAVLFLLLGIWLTLKLRKPQIREVITEIRTEEVAFQSSEKAIEDLGLTPRELEVLHLLSKGLSNKEIGEALHVSLATVKTHTGNLYDKLQVKRRTQAIDTAKSLKIIP